MFLRKSSLKYFIEFSRFVKRSFLTSSYKDVEIPKVTVAEFLFRYVDLHPNNIAFIDDVRNIKYTYSDTKRCINGIASSLTKKGVKAGTIVGIVASNSPEYLMISWALSSIGCTVSICNQNYTQNEIRSQLLDSNPSILFTDNDNVNKVVQATLQIPSVQHIYIIGNRLPSFGSVDDLMEDDGNMSPIGQVDVDTESHVALLPYSSGTTGGPKGVMITHKNLVANMLQINKSIPVNGLSTMLMSLPLYHIYGMVVTPTMSFLSGSPLVFQPKFDSIQFLKIIEKYKVKLLHLVPPLILFFLNNPEVSKYDISAVKKCLCGAAPLDAVTTNRFISKFKAYQPQFDLIQGYGLSETSPLTHVTPASCQFPNKLGSVGTLVPNMRCKVVDVSTREEVGLNTEGEVLLQGPNVMKGYFGRTEATEQTFENKWFRTGDIMYYDEDQFFFVRDRLKELIKVKGLQVAPAEIEGVLLSHPAIADCAVIGVPHEKFGEVPKAFVVKKEEVVEKDINDYVSEHLSDHKHLKGGIIFVNQIPKSPSGKILRRLLKEN